MSGHVAVVTGGSRGIGRAVVERLHADGARVLTCGRGLRPDHVPADVADAAHAARIVATPSPLVTTRWRGTPWAGSARRRTSRTSSPGWRPTRRRSRPVSCSPSTAA